MEAKVYHVLSEEAISISTNHKKIMMLTLAVCHEWKQELLLYLVHCCNCRALGLLGSLETAPAYGIMGTRRLFDQFCSIHPRSASKSLVETGLLHAKVTRMFRGNDCFSSADDVLIAKHSVLCLV